MPKISSPLDALARATILARTRKPKAVSRAVASGEAPPAETDQAVAEDALRVRGLFPWIPPDPAAGAVLIVRGAPPERAGVAIVGARACDPYGLAVAEATARDSVAIGRSVVSGGAEGCDAAAHQAALAAGGHTTVVLGAGHDRPYPAHHRALFGQVVNQAGAVLSPFWPETPPAKYRFLARNQVIAALSAVVVVARARRRSGALSTAAAARALGREVLVVPGPVGEALSEGAHDLLARGARPMCGGASLNRALGEPGGTTWPVRHRGGAAPWVDTAPLEAPGSLSDAAKEARRALQHLGEADTDDLLEATGVSVSELVAGLLELEIRGRVIRLHGGRFTLR